MLYSCNAGDFVLVVWDSTYKNYVVYQENKRNLVFLHPDSIDNLSLKLGSGKYYIEIKLFSCCELIEIFIRNKHTFVILFCVLYKMIVMFIEKK